MNPSTKKESNMLIQKDVTYAISALYRTLFKRLPSLSNRDRATYHRLSQGYYREMRPWAPGLTVEVRMRALRRVLREENRRLQELEQDLDIHYAPQECYADVWDGESRRLARVVDRLGLRAAVVEDYLGAAGVAEGAANPSMDPPPAFEEWSLLTALLMGE